MDPQVQLLNVSGGPDLDLGYNDYLEFRLQLPAGYDGPVRVYWGTTVFPGTAGVRVVTLAAATVPRDGVFHVYRVDMSLEPGWKGYLSRRAGRCLEGAAGVGQSFALDYVRVGDAGPDYLPNYLFYAQGAAGVNDAISKHFRIVWGPGNANFLATAPATARGNLRNMEDQWAVYTKLLNYREPSESTDPAKRNGNKYKVNLMVGSTGLWQRRYFMGYDGASGFGYLIIDPSGLRVDPPAGSTPTNSGMFPVHQGGGYVNNGAMGFWWEAHANLFREQYLKQSALSRNARERLRHRLPNNAHLYHGHGRHYYDHWPIFELPGGKPGRPTAAGHGLCRAAMEESPPANTSMTLARLVAGSLRQRSAWRLRPSQCHLGLLQPRCHLAGAQDQWVPQLVSSSYQRRALTELRRRADDPTWWEVPPEMAPMQGAYNIVELAPAGAGDGRVVTVNFRGLPALGRNVDFRACLVAVNTNGVARYGSLWSAGSNTITLSAAETKLFLSVVATPDEFIPQEADEAKFPYSAHLARMRFPYELQVFGGAPKEFQPTNGGQAGAAHPNGGGFVASTARVDPTAYVGPNAKVLDTAQVRGNARVEDFAVVQNSAQVLDRAVVSGHARIRNNAQISGQAKLRDYGLAADNARVTDHARIFEGGAAIGHRS